jgi:hypothetical protein
MQLVIELPISDDEACSRYELAISMFADFLLARFGTYQRFDAEYATRSGHMRYHRTHKFKLLFFSRADAIAAENVIEEYLRHRFGKPPVSSA